MNEQIPQTTSQEVSALSKSQLYYIKNSDKIKAKHKCDVCKGTYTHYNKNKHLKSLKHKKVTVQTE